MTTEQMEAMSRYVSPEVQQYKDMIRKLIKQLEKEHSDYRGDKWVGCLVCNSTKTQDSKLNSSIVHYENCVVAEAKKLIGG